LAMDFTRMPFARQSKSPRDLELSYEIQ
jgi:hypothetical protein